MSDQTPIPSESAHTKPRKRKWYRKLFVAGLLLSVVAAGLPPLIGQTSLRNRIVPHWFPELAGRVSLGSTTLGWFSPIAIDDLKILDHDDTLMLHSRRVRSKYTLLDLILEPSDLGEWTLSDSTVQLTVEPGTSNVEEFLNSLTSEEENAPCSLSIQTRDTTLRVSQPATGRIAVYQLPRFGWERTRQNQDRLAGEIVAQTESHGTISFDLTRSDRWNGFLKVRQWDCAAFEPLAVRLERDLRIKGQVTEAGVLISSQTDSPQFEGTLALTDLCVEEAGTTLADVRSFDVGVQLDATPSGIRLSKLNCRSEFGTLILDGEVLVPFVNEQSRPAALAETLLARNFSLDGEIQLGELARRLPGILRIREGVDVSEGSLKFIARSIPAENVLETSLSVTDLVAQDATRSIRWDNPFQAVGRIRKSDSFWQLDDLAVTSAGIEIRGTGTLAEADLTAKINLTDFQQEWSRILDTHRWIARGTLEGSFSSRQSGPNEFQLAGQANGQNISCGAKNEIPWEFPRLKTTLSGTVVSGRELTLSVFSFDLETRQEQLVARKQPYGIWHLSGSGELEGLASQWFVRSPEDRLAGRYRFNTHFQKTPALTKLDGLQLTIEDLAWSSGSRRLDEKKLIVEGTATYRPESGAIEIPLLTLNSSTVAARLTEARFQQNAERSQMAGQLAARGRVERVVQLLGAESNATSPRGLLNLQLKAIAQADETTEFRWKMFTEHLEWSRSQPGLPAHAVSYSPASPVPPSPSPSPSEIIWNGLGTYHPAEHRLDLSESDLDAGFLQLKLAGNVTDISTSPRISVSGPCTYDWAVLKRRFPGLFTPELDIQGAHSSPLVLSIPLPPSDPRKMSGTFPVQWDSANWHGLPIGPGKADAVFTDARIDFQPVQTSLAGGTVRLSPSVIFSDQGTVVEQTPESIFEQAHLSETICRNWLKFVSPLTADASRVEGTFSLKTSKLLRLPLEDTRSAAGTGVLQIHSASMTPGPLAMQIVTLEKQIEAIRAGTPLARPAPSDPRAVLTIEQQAVPFEIKDGRVSHRNLKMKLKDLDISTSGSVGFDETIDLTVEMEIPESWTVQGKRLRDVWGASLKIPIRGSLQKPLTDPQFIDALLKQLARGSATNFLENQLNKQLNNLFGPRK